MKKTYASTERKTAASKESESFYQRELKDISRAKAFDKESGKSAAEINFLNHWRQTVIAAQKLIRAGEGDPVWRATFYLMIQMVETACEGDESAGSTMFSIGHSIASTMVGLATTPPSWLHDAFNASFSSAWLMINGKPAPGYPKRTLTKHGKSRFDAPQTEAVAKGIQEIEFWRRIFSDKPASYLELFEPLDDYIFRNSKKLATLPPLNAKSKEQWWPLIKKQVKLSAKLTQKQKENILATTYHGSEAELWNEFMKRCKKAFDGLCPEA